HSFCASLQTPLVQALSNTEQSRAVGPAHVPPVHTSPTVQNSPSLQPSPSFAACASQALAPSLQTPTVHAPSRPEQSRGVGPAHVPLVQTSPTVQNSPSLQPPPSLAACASQASVDSLQTPTVHWPSSEEQSGAVPAKQTPAT